MAHDRLDHLVEDWRYKVTLGHHPEVTHWNKFGSNPSISTTEEDVWSYGGTQTLLTTGTTLFITCDDNVNGQGQTLRVYTLDENWDEKITEVVLQGHTPVQIGAANSHTRVHRAYQISAAPDPVGDVYIAEADTYTLGVPDTAAKVHGFIDYTDAAQQTDMASFTVPAGRKALITRFHAEVQNIETGAARDALVFIEVAELAVGATLAAPTWTPRRRVAAHTLGTAGGPSDTTIFPFPLVCPELTNISVRAIASAASEIAAEFTVLLLPVE